MWKKEKKKNKERKKFLGHTADFQMRDTFYVAWFSTEIFRGMWVKWHSSVQPGSPPVFSRRNYLTFLEILQLITRPPSHMPELRLENGGSDVERASLGCFMEPGGLFDIVIGVQQRVPPVGGFATSIILVGSLKVFSHVICLLSFFFFWNCDLWNIAFLQSYFFITFLLANNFVRTSTIEIKPRYVEKQILK